MASLLCMLQAWLVPHIPEETASIGCGFGSAAAVHSGFSVSWQNKLKQAVCALVQTVVNHNSEAAANTRVLITGMSLLCMCRAPVMLMKSNAGNSGVPSLAFTCAT